MDKTGLITTESQIFRLAIVIRNQILQLKDKEPETEMYRRNIDAMSYNIGQLEDLERLRNKAISYEWFLAARKLEFGKHGTIQEKTNKILDNAKRIHDCINKTYDSETYVPSIKNLIEEIKVAKNTFKTLSYRDKILSIKTHKITLSDGDNEIELGDFEINFNLGVKFDSRLGYILVIEALNPNPAQGRPAVTHPHVDDERLCAGDGDILIRQALQQGRIEDAFKLVLAVLNNYNDRSPYVSLDEWNGEVYCCEECGVDDLTEDTICSCESCDQIFCENCISSCDKCSRSTCMECSSRCEACDCIMCNGCAESTTCKGCDQIVCEDCMEICTACGKNRCDECLKGCEGCDAKICSECKIECEECSTELCSDCLMKCDNCKKNLCSTCHEADSCNMFAKV